MINGITKEWGTWRNVKTNHDHQTMRHADNRDYQTEDMTIYGLYHFLCVRACV